MAPALKRGRLPKGRSQMIFRFSIPAVLLTGAMLIWHPAAGEAQGRGVDMGCSPTIASPCSGGSSGGSTYSPPAYTPPAVYEPSPADLKQRQMVALSKQGQAQYQQGKFLEARRLYQLALNMAVSAADIETLKGNIANTHQGVGNLASKRGDIDQALREYELANQNRPGDAVILDSLTYLRGEVATRQQVKSAEQRDKAAAKNMQQAIQNFAQTLKAAPSTGGLDFDGNTFGNVPGGGNSGGPDFTVAVVAPTQTRPAASLPLGDPRVVDASNAPSGLSKPVENAIAAAYQNAPPGVSDRVRKGFQAVADHDWKVAKAWFEEALNRDPGNANLKRLVALAGAPPEPTQKSAASPVDQNGSVTPPDPGDIRFRFPGLVDAMDRAQAKNLEEVLGLFVEAHKLAPPAR